MIVEGLVTSRNSDGSVRVAPMGPRVVGDFESLVLRPFPTSQTYDNLRRTGHGVFHVTDDVELLARAAVGCLEHAPPLRDVEGWDVPILAGACRWFAFEVMSIDESDERKSLHCPVRLRGTLRDFLGWNRAKHAVLEAAILATRLHLLPRIEVETQWRQLEPLVRKTGGEQERAAWTFLCEYVAAYYRQPPS